MNLLLLAGTGMARRIADELAKMTGLSAVASLSGATRDPVPLALPTRIGGFGGEAEFRDYLAANQIEAVLDATHPFADRISHRTARVCEETGLPYALVLRPEWVPEAGDQWTGIANEAEAAHHIAPGSTVFLATGRQTLLRFANLQNCRLICRQIDPPDGPFPFPNGQFLIGRPPFSVQDEETLFRKLAIDWLITKNAGGEPPRTKLIAARRLGLPVLMIKRPVQPRATTLRTVPDVLAWVRGQL